MMRLRIAGLLVLVATYGCSMGPREDDPVYLRTIENDNRLTRLERLLDNEGLVNLLSRLDALQADVEVMRNDLDTLQNGVEQSNGRQRELYLDVDKRLQSIERSTIRNDDMTVLEGGELNPGQLPVPGGTDRANYQAAFELLKQGRYDEASIALKQFMVAFPSSSLGDNAQYWLAETYYVSQDYEQALPEFQKVLDRFPDSRKLPDALLKIGYCNYELALWDASRDALSAVVNKYSDTTAARLANQRLERLQSEGR